MSVDPMDAAVKLAELTDLASEARRYDEGTREEMATLAAVVLGLKWVRRCAHGTQISSYT